MLSIVILIFAMLLLSAFFSGMEIAFTSKNRLKLEIDRKQSRMFDRIAEVFSRHPGQYITTILVGNNIALVVYSLAMSLLLRETYGALGWESLALEGSVALDTAVSTLVIIFVAEFLPKSIFKNNPNFYYRALAPAIYFFYILLYPLARFTTLLSHGILRLLGRRVKEQDITPSFNREDLAALLEANNTEQHAEPDNELKLFQNALDFADLRVRDCMVPRVDIEAVDIEETSIGQLTARFVDSKYSRIFVWRGSIDNIVDPADVVYVKSIGRKVLVRLSDARVLESYAALVELEQQLPGSFVRCHKSYLANMEYVVQASADGLVMDCNEAVPISQRQYRTVRDALRSFSAS